jgi:hypothetical protein
MHDSLYFLIMKYLIFFIFTISSCKTSTSKTTEVNNVNELVKQQNMFTKIINGDNSYVLYYKVEKSINNPVKIFTYYIMDNQSKKVIKTSEQVAAEKIYWKDNTILAIIPYTEVMQKNDVVGAPDSTNEILIKIK